MNCKEAESLLSQSLDGELESAGKQSLLREHLESCPSCREMEESWRGFGEFMREEEVPVPESASAGLAWEKIHREIRLAESPAEEGGGYGFGRKTRSPWFWGWGAPTAIAALLVLSTGLYYNFYSGSGLPSINESPGEFAGAPGNGIGTRTKTKIEFLETDIPGGSTMVFVDQDTGWTVLWVAESESAEG